MEYYGEQKEICISCLQASFDPLQHVQKSEQHFANELQCLSQALVHRNKQIILLAGPSASGKTTTAMKLIQLLASYELEATLISLDDFYLNREDIPLLENGQRDFETLASLDLDYLDQVIKNILNGESIELPKYDFISGMRLPHTQHIPYQSDLIYVFEGIHALDPKLSLFLDRESAVRIFVDTASNYVDEQGILVLSQEDIRLTRRLVRDYYFRNASVDLTLSLWPNVRSGEALYIRPYETLADYFLNSLHGYEPMVYKELLRNIVQESTQYASQAKALVDKYEGIEPIAVQLVPATSLLQEFLPK
ncbi:MAG: uridine kinase family protein [Erysipelotrichaceae bacterium]